MPRPANDATQPRGKRTRRKNASATLLERAAEDIGMSVLSEALGVPVNVLEGIRDDEHPMTLQQQRVLALAVLVSSDGYPDLRRRAAALLGQVTAAEAFSAGVTERHTEPPRLPWK